MDNKWLIWSNEHNSWWAPSRRGYVNDVRFAGRYSFEEAVEIVRSANILVRTNRTCVPNEAMVMEEPAYMEEGKLHLLL